ncbi:hypothetical protein B0T16DRAFT_399678 [Cercophora newfieldiana]|uniref:HMG box domain-containing protein n=1 Tax=Cercophora newfieldiana TaxID=92897 RepID=A0AA40CYX5_9PEZI|nr:hypothetical protein B0T16DRAFT_399678 [Cercophora newfieldiana]
MPRPPKNKAVEAPKPVAPAPAPVAVAPPKPHPVIDVDNFVRVRDSVYQRLSTIQDLIKSFSQDYLRQTNLLLGEGTSIDGVDLEQQFGFGQLAQFAGVPQPAAEEKKERKKRTHDPNAPKRPLTPYFLYMQTARPIIASDLGEDAPKGAVQEEGQRRWAVMGAIEKAGWNQAYKYNLRLYNARVHSYKHGNAAAKEMDDAEALKYADEFNIEMPTVKDVEDVGVPDQDAIAQQLQESAAAEDASEEEPAPAAKTPKKTQVRRRKTATPATEAEPAKVIATPSSPEVKKRKRASKAAELEEPKKSGRKKTKSG